MTIPKSSPSPLPPAPSPPPPSPSPAALAPVLALSPRHDASAGARCASCGAEVPSVPAGRTSALCAACTGLAADADAPGAAAPAPPSEEAAARARDSAMIFANWERLQRATRRRVGPAMAFFDELRAPDGDVTWGGAARPNFSCYRCLLCVRVAPTAEKIEEIRNQVLAGRRMRRPFGYVVKHFSSTKGGTSALYNHANRTHSAALRLVRALVERAADSVSPGADAPPRTAAPKLDSHVAADEAAPDGPAPDGPPAPHTSSPRRRRARMSALGSAGGRADTKRRRVRGAGVRQAQGAVAEIELAAAMCKALTPLAALDDPWFRRWARRGERDAVAVPTRARMADEVLPRLVGDLRSEVSRRTMTAAAVSLSWDLWVQRDEERVYSLRAFFIDDEWEQHCFSLGNVTVVGDGDECLENSARRIRELLDAYGVLHKVVAVDTGPTGGENLLCQVAARVGGIGAANGGGVQHAVAAHGVPFFEVPCLARSIAAAADRACGNEAGAGYEGEPVSVGVGNVAFADTKEAVASMISFVNGSNALEDAQEGLFVGQSGKEETVENDAKLFPWVDSKFMTLFRSWRRVLEQKKHLLELSHADGSPGHGLQQEQWFFVSAIVKSLQHVYKLCEDANGRWLLPDAVRKVMRLVTENCDQLLSIQETIGQLPVEHEREAMLSTANVEHEQEGTEKLLILEGWLVERILLGLETVVEPLISYRPERAYYFLAIAADPRMCSLSELMQMTKRLMQARLFQFADRAPEADGESLVHEVRAHVKNLVEEYDVGVLIPMMVCSMEDSVPKREQEVDEGGSSLLQDGQIDDGGVLEKEFEGGLFPRQGEVDPEEARRKSMSNEVERFRHHEKTFVNEKEGEGQVHAGIEWWKTHGCLYPSLSMVYRQIVSIPSSFVDLERVFTPQGVLVALRREGLSVDCRNDVAYVHENLTDAVFTQYHLRDAGEPALAKRELDEEQMLAEIKAVVPELLRGSC